MSVIAPVAGAEAARGELISSRLARYLYLDQIHRPYLKWQVEQFLPYLGQRILEIGCGVGGIIDLLGSRELIYGLDVDEDILEYAARRFRERADCRFALLDITKIESEQFAQLKQHQFDSIVCINVLEHIRDDIAALQRMEQLLPAGGRLASLVPAHSALYGSYDKLDGHYRRYTKAYLRTLLLHTNLRPLRMVYFNGLGAIGWWVHYKLLGRKIHGEAQFGLQNKLIPLLRAAERVCAPPFGLSLIAICEKPAE